MKHFAQIKDICGEAAAKSLAEHIGTLEARLNEGMPEWARQHHLNNKMLKVQTNLETKAKHISELDEDLQKKRE